MPEPKPTRDWVSIHIDPEGSAGVPKLSDVRDLAARLKFSPRDGRIWLDDQRMLLMHTADFAGLRRELLDAIGLEGTRRLLTRLGFSAGARDAALALQLRANKDLKDAFAAGPQLHALKGFVAVEPVRVDVDIERGVHYVEQLWHDSAEASAHLEAAGVSTEPACWMQIGYASGFNSALFGRPILFREMQCKACGAASCRIVGKPVDQWNDADDDLRFLRPEDFVNANLVRQTPALKGPDGRVIEPDEQAFMVGASSGFVSACHKLQQVAPTNATVLLLGETGVGKERFARMLHRISRRFEGPFVALNCAAIPDNLLESELFGVERGAYTGAVESRKGRFERADRGTLFLDEIGALNEAAQAKLLRALQEREIERVGGSSVRRVDVRVVAATNADLALDVKEGRFRSDLFYRLNVFPIHIPPVRERRDDIAMLVHHFVKRFSESHGKSVTGFTHRAISALLNYDYPGNVRELENIIERGVIMATEGKPLDRNHLFLTEVPLQEATLSVDHLGAIRPAADSMADIDVQSDIVSDIVERVLDASLSLENLELAAMKAAVKRADGNLSQAARQLGISRAQLAYRLDK